MTATHSPLTHFCEGWQPRFQLIGLKKGDYVQEEALLCPEGAGGVRHFIQAQNNSMSQHCSTSAHQHTEVILTMGLKQNVVK